MNKETWPWARKGKKWACSPAAKVTTWWWGLRRRFDRVRKSLVIATKDGKVALRFALLVASQKSLG